MIKKLLTLYLLFLILSLYTISKFPLTPDEAYYYFWSVNFKVWTIEHPPFVSWLIKLFSFNKRETFIRISAFLIGGFILPFFTYTIIESITKDKELSMISAIYPLWTLLGAVSLIIITPDIPFMLGVVLTLFVVIKKVKPVWFWLSLSLSITILSKHTGWLWLISVIVPLFLLKEIDFKEILKSLALVFVMTLPYLIFEVKDGLSGIRLLFSYHFIYKRSELNLPLVTSFIWFLGQIFILNPLIAIKFILNINRGIETREERLLRYIFILFYSPFLLLSLFYLPEQNWTAPALYLAFLWFIIICHRERRKSLVKIAFIIGVIVVASSYILLYFPLGNIKPIEKMRGWHEIKKLKLPEDSVIIAKDYQIFSELYFYGSFKNLYLSFKDPRAKFLNREKKRYKDFIFIDRERLKGDEFRGCFYNLLKKFKISKKILYIYKVSCKKPLFP